ncbi:PAS domain-containing sensor histidine kinase [Pseudaquabacterium rugosum]|uniref:histidine kinase n=1 Tax=Pseudaquabacterium rugosum TaxID=2984194 RepID=A0ABU9B8D6_9BURK
MRRRPFGRWWRQQSPARQDRFVTLAPLASVLLFLAAIITAFWYLRNEEIERASESVQRDTEIAQQQIRLRLIEHQEQLVRLAQELAAREVSAQEFDTLAADFLRRRPEVQALAWLDGRGRARAQQPPLESREDGAASAPGPAASRPAGAPSSAASSTASNALTPAAAQPGAAASPAAGASHGVVAALPDSPPPEAVRRGLRSLRDLRQPVYTEAWQTPQGGWSFQLQVPLLARGLYAGALTVTYGVDALVRHVVPTEVMQRHPVLVLDAEGRTLAGALLSLPGQVRTPPQILHEVPLAPTANGLVLRGTGWRSSVGLVGNTLFWMVVALSGLTVWTLLGSWRHLRRRSQIQGALVQETNFRRAMENSMLTGMRAMDMEGRVTYVNPAFCAMTGYGEHEMIGGLPPFPYWPADRIEENSRLFQQELQGRSPAGGIEVKVQRKNGSIFDARMYVSPLVDAKGQQTGWMTSMTNITEAKRIRDQLSASHERFTTVLEGLDAAVSVLSVQQGELLFANRSYRLWFGADARGHGQLATGSQPNLAMAGEADDVDGYGGLPTQELANLGANPREVYVESLDKWFDVRSRYLQWTDGRLAQMLIATDVTARRRAEEQAAQQAEKAQVSSRLITMGEMASSVAHELNQPLTAISNYCNGMVSRVQAGTIDNDGLIAALEKTSKQAQRAGQIIHRIRNFVKKSEPQRQDAQAADIVEDAVELASIELRRRSVQIQTYVAQRLPMLRCDPILIEQVLMNLLKNAAEAIDTGQMPPPRRQIELRVVPRPDSEDGNVIEFSVTDKGPGIAEDVINRLYEAFFSTKAEGMGIGLSLCRSIIESHQGRIRARNLYNGDQVSGCQFTFTLPVGNSPTA